MKLELISKNKLKIIFYPDDARNLNINADVLRSDEYALSDVFTYILKAAKRQTGFDPGNGAVSIESVVNGDGSLILYFTKLESEPQAKKGLRVRAKTASVRKRISEKLIFSFKNFDDLLTSVHIVCRADISSSRLYEHSGKYFLCFAADFTSKEECDVFVALLSEYGKKCGNSANNAIREAYLNENAVLISEENVVEKLCRAAGIK